MIIACIINYPFQKTALQPTRLDLLENIRIKGMTSWNASIICIIQGKKGPSVQVWLSIFSQVTKSRPSVIDVTSHVIPFSLKDRCTRKTFI
jgi:hypothetical protein